jgi:hypothetical protein
LSQKGEGGGGAGTSRQGRSRAGPRALPLHAGFSGYARVGKGLDGELLDLHHRSGRTLPTVVRLISCDSSLSKIRFNYHRFDILLQVAELRRRMVYNVQVEF